jgi:hypothetical protein
VPPCTTYQHNGKIKDYILCGRHLPNANPFFIFLPKILLKIERLAGWQWLMLVILATQEAEIRRISVESQPRQRVLET